MSFRANRYATPKSDDGRDDRKYDPDEQEPDIFEDVPVSLQYRLAHQRQVGPGYQNSEGLLIPKDLQPIPSPKLGLYKKFRDPRTGRVFAVDLLNHWYSAKNESADFWLVEDTNSAGRPSRATLKWCKVTQLPRSLFTNGVLDFRQIFGTDEFMRPYLRLTEFVEGRHTLVYPYDIYGNPTFPVCPIRTANMSDHDKYKPCPNHKFYGDDHYTLALDWEGRPIFPPNKRGEPVVPMNREGTHPIYPADLFGLGVIYPVDCMGTPIMAVDVEGRQRPFRSPYGHTQLPTSLSSMAPLVSQRKDGTFRNARDVLRVEWLGMVNERLARRVQLNGIKRPLCTDRKRPIKQEPAD